MGRKKLEKGFGAKKMCDVLCNVYFLEIITCLISLGVWAPRGNTPADVPWRARRHSPQTET